VRFLLRAQRAGNALVGVEQPRFLDDRPPSSMRSICRFASCSIAAMTKRTELTFLVSVRVPSGSPGLRTLTLTSARIEPSSILPSHEPT
jgi:hypothetical protein